AVRREAPGAAPGHPCKLDPPPPPPGAAQITDHDVVGTAFGVELDLLDAVEIHGHDTDVAGEAHAAAVVLDVELLVDVGAVEHQCVGARLALDDVTAVSRIPNERIVGRAEQGRVAAAATVDGVIAAATEQRVVAVAAGDGVVARAAVDREFDEIGEPVSGGYDVIAAIGVEVAAVARIPDHAIVAGFAEHLIAACAADQHVVA